MNKLMKKCAFSGFKPTPILATLTFIFGLCLLLEHTVDPDENSVLTCTSSVYRVGEGFVGQRELYLKNTRHGIDVAFSLFKQGVLIRKVKANGTVEKIQAPILTYEVNLANGQYLRGLFEKDEQRLSKSASQLAEVMLGDAQKEQFLIKVLEMNKVAGAVTVKIDPGNHLWACKLIK
ncbi:hypothetical protein [uncultured Shewanella sp.]|uniref:hypothetical protein n=1 Tax=uncultured Shewanella sp. TaxID=173975 RepID=UPI002638F309|nr:hypothetical protein [uncultured Shewanella sp.]